MKDTITLETLYKIFHKIKNTNYMESVDLSQFNPDFVATPEMIFYSMQKEFSAYACICMN